MAGRRLGVGVVALAVVVAVVGSTGFAGGTAVLGADSPRDMTPTRALYDRLRDATRDADNGIAVEQHVTADGQRQLIVYLGGATFDPTNQFVLRNIPSYNGELDDGHLRRVTEALAGDPEWRIMLVGFSQGGMDAQNMAAKASFKDQVTTVVTFASPIVQQPGAFDAVHLWDAGDMVPRLTFPRYAAEYRSVSGQVFEKASANDPALIYHADLPTVVPSAQPLGALLHVVQKLALHGARSTYQQVAHAFDTTAGFDAVKADIDAYLRHTPVT